MANQKIELGPSGRRLAKNVATRRRELGFDLAKLSDMLAAVGRPIGVSALSKVEQGVRRVDADDLVALAACLDTTPAWLLAHPERSWAMEKVSLTSKLQVTGRALWLWITGARPLRDDDLEDDGLGFGRTLTQVETRPKTPDDWAFQAVNRPADVIVAPVLVQPEVRAEPCVQRLEAAYIEALNSVPEVVLNAVVRDIQDEHRKSLTPEETRELLQGIKALGQRGNGDD